MVSIELFEFLAFFVVDNKVVGTYSSVVCYPKKDASSILFLISGIENGEYVLISYLPRSTTELSPLPTIRINLSRSKNL